MGMTATDELRRMLDERGVEWEDNSPVPSMKPWKTSFTSFTGEEVSLGCYDEPKWIMGTMVFHAPEQAIEATLGRGTCHPVANDNLTESEGTGDAWANCSECGHLLCVLTDPSSQMPNYCPNCGRKVVDDASVD